MTPALRRLILRLVLILLIPIGVAGFVFTTIYGFVLKPKDSASKETRLIQVVGEMTTAQIGEELEKMGVINSASSLSIISMLQRKGPPIVAGEYQVSPALSPKEILLKFQNGDVYLRKVVFPVGFSIWEMGDLLEKAGVILKIDFDESLTDRSLLITAGIAADNFEGYLYPGEYLLTRLDSAKNTARDVIFKMIKKGEQEWKPEYTKKADQMRLSRHEVLTLASIIEKELDETGQYGLLASTLNNRIEQAMKLESDATVIYGLKNYKGTVAQLTDKERNTNHHYNTYFRFGLPPGPICNPSVDSITAVLYPEETDYLFYRRDSSGTIRFTAEVKSLRDVLPE